jgi:hypothetical protein
VQADGAWTLVGYPRYVPEMPDLVTLDDCVYDLFVREFDFNPYLYGPATRQQARQNAFPLPGDPPKQYNENYFPYWDTEIYPILSRPFLYGWTVAALGQADPHETGPGGMALDMSKISLPPKDGADPYLQMRQFVYRILRKIGQENRLTLTTPVNAPGVAPLEIPMMPLLNGDNPLTNEIVSKFFTLTETQLFILKQWADGKFIPGNLPNGSTPIGPSMPPGVAIDRGVLGNALGGSFCPGGEVTWIIRNPEIWASPYRIRHARDFGPNQTAESTGDTNGINYFNSNAQLSLGDNPSGFEPGDLTKRSALPWQSDFNECTTNSTDVTFENANVNYLPPDQQLTYGVIWWPAHRPLQVFVPSDPANPATSGSAQRDWASPIPETNIGDAMMVSLWNQLGFVRNYGSYASPNFVEIERLLPRPGGI